MLRFAIGVTFVELALTTTAAMFLASTIENELFFEPGDVAALGLPVESHSTSYVRRFDALFSYDTTVTSGTVRLWISVRPEPTAADYTLRRLRESSAAAAGGPGSIFVDEDGSEERGYLSRVRGRGSVRAEVVRVRPDALLIVRVGQSWESDAGSEEAAARCERRARLVAARMAEKLRWRF